MALPHRLAQYLHRKRKCIEPNYRHRQQAIRIRRAGLQVTKEKRQTEGTLSAPRSATPASSKPTQHPPPAQSCRLLALPPELRNRIYEFSLVAEAGHITVTLSTKQPPLLHTCTQIRAEAKSMWYNSNRFQIPVRDCDGTPYLAWLKHCRGLEVETVMVQVQFDGFPNWQNLIVWLRERHEHAIPWPICSFDDTLAEEWRLVSVAHATLVDYRFRPWADFENVVKRMRYLVEPYEDAWKD